MRFASTPFPETLRSLRRDRPLRLALGIAATLILSAIWLAWLVAARIPVFVATPSAQLRASSLPLQVVAEVEGRVESIHARLGAELEGQEVLLILDTRAERLRLEEILSAEKTALREGEALTSELGFRRLVLERSLLENRHSVEQAIQRAEQARLAAEAAFADAGRSSTLAEEGLLSEARAQHDLAVARQLAVAQKASQEAVEAARREGEGTAEDLRAEIAALERQLAKTSGDLEGVQARRRLLEDEIDRHFLRAPASGRLTDVRDFSQGSLIRVGDYVATILSDTGLSAVGWFPVSDALARIREDQAAQLRLDGFPWTEYGALQATVQRVAGEERDGRIRVECRLAEPAQGSVIPLQHGLPGSLIIEIERASPLSLLLRSLGRRIFRIDSSPENTLSGQP